MNRVTNGTSTDLLEPIGDPVGQLDIENRLPEYRPGRAPQAVRLMTDFQVPDACGRYAGIIGEEGLLRSCSRRDAKDHDDGERGVALGSTARFSTRYSQCLCLNHTSMPAGNVRQMTIMAHIS